MEPTDLKNIPPDDAQLEAWLRSANPAAPLPDDGFTPRVLAALPPSTAAHGVRRRMLCVTAGAIAGTVVAFSLGGDDPGHWPDVVQNLNAALQPLSGVLPQLLKLPAVCALTVAFASVLFAFRGTPPAPARNQ